MENSTYVRWVSKESNGALPNRRRAPSFCPPRIVNNCCGVFSAAHQNEPRSALMRSMSRYCSRFLESRHHDFRSGFAATLQLPWQALDRSFFCVDLPLNSGDLAALIVDLRVVREPHHSQFQSGRSPDLLGDSASHGVISIPKPSSLNPVRSEVNSSGLHKCVSEPWIKCSETVDEVQALRH